MNAKRKLAVVTGSSRGIGHAITVEILQRGWTVIGMARSSCPPDLDGVAGYRHVQADLSLPAELPATLERERLLAGTQTAARIALVNNAGRLGRCAPLRNLEIGDLQRTVNLNLVTPGVLVGYFLRQEPTVPFRVVDLSSGAAEQPYAGWAAYCSTKIGLRMLGRVAALEVESSRESGGGHADFSLLSFAPNVVDTAMQGELRDADPTDFPMRSRFEELHRDGKLIPPTAPARWAADFLDADGLPTWNEARYEPGRSSPFA